MLNDIDSNIQVIGLLLFKYEQITKGSENLKDSIKIIFILLGLIIANILVFSFGVDDVTVSVIVVFIIAYHKAYISQKFTDIFNIHSFKYTFSINNLLELVGALLIGLCLRKIF